jgi:hypothetical protein
LKSKCLNDKTTASSLPLKSNLCPLGFELCHLLLLAVQMNRVTTFLNILMIDWRASPVSSREASCWRTKGRLSGAARDCPENR